MIKKRYFVLLVSLLVGTALFAAGCSKGDNDSNNHDHNIRHRTYDCTKRGQGQSRLHFETSGRYGIPDICGQYAFRVYPRSQIQLLQVLKKRSPV